MRIQTLFVVLGGTAALAACTVAPPTAPSVMALPQQGKGYDVFMQDDVTCRQTASMYTGGPGQAQAATNNAVGTALLGTALGAGAGAALGSVGGAMGAGAAIGGATGLLAGSAIGAGNAQASAGNLQQQYDTVYTQCMYARGNTVQAPPPPVYAVPAYPYAPSYPYTPGWYGPAYGGTSVVIGGGWGWGGYPRRYYRGW
ncbi:MAG: glycine zipper family protein [Acetobacteraceae bacterium]